MDDSNRQVKATELKYKDKVKENNDLLQELEKMA